jgi:hypothetical protein
MNIITTEEHLHYIVVIGLGRMFQYVEGTYLLNYLLTYLLTPSSRVLLERFVASQEFTAFY